MAALDPDCQAIGASQTDDGLAILRTGFSGGGNAAVRGGKCRAKHLRRIEQLAGSLGVRRTRAQQRGGRGRAKQGAANGMLHQLTSLSSGSRAA